MSISRVHTAAARTAAQAKQPHVLVVGGGYGGVSVISNLLNLSKGGKQLPCPVPIDELELAPKVKPTITLLAERDGIFHTMGSPLSNICRDFSREAWLQYEDIPYLKDPSVHVRHGRAHAIDPTKRTATYIDPSNVTHTIPYDVLVLAHGTHRPWPNVPAAQTKAQYLDNGDEHVARLEAARNVAVVGGGAVGVEMATSLKAKFPCLQVALIHSRPTLLGAEPLPDEFKAKVLELVGQKGVETILGRRVVASSIVGEDDNGNDKDVGLTPHHHHHHHRLSLSDGQVLCYDMVLDSTGYAREAQAEGAAAGEQQDLLLRRSGNLAVQATLQLAEPIPNAAFHFAVGDVARWTGIKRAGNAMIMGQYAASNILKLLDLQHQQQQQQQQQHQNQNQKDCRPKTTDLLQCPDFEPMMALSVGDEAVAYTKASGVVWGKEVKDKLIGRGLGIDRCSEYLRFDVNGVAGDRV